jgi:hypothetical protein
MRVRTLFTFSLVLVGCSFLSAQEKAENPFKKAKVGDFVTYKTTIKGQKDGSTIRQTVLEVTDKEVTIEVVASFGGKEFPASKTKIDLSQPYDPAAMAKGKVEVKTLDSGKETLTIGDKKYDCTWTKTKVTTKVGDKDFTSEAKTWVCKDVPLNGVVKVETISDFVNSTMELVEAGNKK